MDVAVDHQAFDLVEHRRVGLIGIAAVGAAGRDDAVRRLVRLHVPDLHRRGVGAQQHLGAIVFFRQVEAVVHLPRRVVGRNVERGEIVEVVFDVGAFGDGEALGGEDGDDFVHHLADRMDSAQRLGAHRQRHVDPLGGELGFQIAGGDGCLSRIDGGGDGVFGEVDRLAARLALFRPQRPQALHQFGDGAFFAQRADAEVFEFGGGGCRGNAIEHRAGQCVEVVHDCILETKKGPNEPAPFTIATR